MMEGKILSYQEEDLVDLLLLALSLLRLQSLDILLLDPPLVSMMMMVEAAAGGGRVGDE